MNTTSSRKARAGLLVAAAVAATLVACGDGDDDDGGETPTARATAPAATATRSPASPTVAAPVGTPTSGVEASPTTAAPPPVENTAVPPPVQDTQAPPPPPPTNTPVPPPPPTGVTVLIKALTTAFSPNSAAVPAGAVVTLTFDNQDAGVMHDFVLYGSGGGVVTSTNVATGPNAQTVTFALTPGQYAFKCSVHPREMTGSITAQ